MTKDKIEVFGIVFSICLSIFALYLTNQSSNRIQCLEETVPKTISKIQQLEGVRNRSLASLNEFQSIFVGLTIDLQKLQRGQNPNFQGADLENAFYRAVTVGGLSIEDTKRSLKPYLSEDQMAALEEVSKYPSTSVPENADVADKLSNAIETMTSLSNAVNRTNEFVGVLVKEEVEKRISDACD